MHLIILLFYGPTISATIKHPLRRTLVQFVDHSAFIKTCINPPQYPTPISHLLSPTSHLLSPISYLLPPISYLLSPISYLLSPISYLLLIQTLPHHIFLKKGF